MQGLPLDATAESRVRYGLAQALARHWPAELGGEIALTGSASRGTSDAGSDIEIICWVDEVPFADALVEWLREVGATDAMPDEGPIEDGSIWVTCRFRSIWVEVGWQTIVAQRQLLDETLAGHIIDHARLAVASAIVHAVPLRSVGLLPGWQQELTHYPEQLPPRLVRAAIEDWRFPHMLDARRVIARRRARLALAERLVRDCERVLRILFALNHQWEPDWKWGEVAVDALRIRPERATQRIRTIFEQAEPRESVKLCLELMRDALTLVPRSRHVDQAVSAIETCLERHA